MMICRECRQPIASEEAPGIGTYWFHSSRGRESTAFCGRSGEWSFDRIAQPFDEPVYIVSREHKITQFGLDGMWFKIREIQQDNVIWELVDIDNPERRIYVPGFWCKEPFERTEVEDDESGIF